MKTLIVVKTSHQGFHRWENAAGTFDWLLRQEHRHLFNFEVEVEVTDDDRQIEFFDFKDKVDTALQVLFQDKDNPFYLDFKGCSCEQIAKKLADQLKLGCYLRSISVFEDTENGARVLFYE